jgi:hypothetical protein
VRENFVWNRGVLQRNTDHVAAGGLTTLANRISHFPGFSQANTNAALLVTDNDKSAKIKTTAAFDDLGRSVDEDDFLGQFLATLALKTGFRFSGLATAAWTATAITAFATFTALLLLLLLRRLLLLLFRTAIYIIVFVSHNIFSLLFC